MYIMTMNPPPSEYKMPKKAETGEMIEYSIVYVWYPLLGQSPI